MSESDLTRQLEDLFRETGQAHHQAYSETDGADPEWPLWYAGYLHESLGSLLGASFTKSELVYLLIRVANEQPLGAPARTGPGTTPVSLCGDTRYNVPRPGPRLGGVLGGYNRRVRQGRLATPRGRSPARTGGGP